MFEQQCVALKIYHKVNILFTALFDWRIPSCLKFVNTSNIYEEIWLSTSTLIIQNLMWLFLDLSGYKFC